MCTMPRVIFCGPGARLPVTAVWTLAGAVDRSIIVGKACFGNQVIENVIVIGIEATVQHRHDDARTGVAHRVPEIGCYDRHAVGQPTSMSIMMTFGLRAIAESPASDLMRPASAGTAL